MKEFRLGILFVHGIGTQPPRDTLVRWGDVLLKVIGRATEEEPGRTIPIVRRANAGDRSGDKPAEVVVEFRCNDREEKEKWLLAEGWWADSFPAPTYSELVSWSFRAVPWSIALHIAQRFWQTNPKASKGAWRWAAAKAAAQLLGAAWIAAALLRWRWSVWVRTEQEAVLAHKTPDWKPFDGPAIVISVLGVLAIALALGFESRASTLLANPQFGLIAPVVITAIVGIAVWISVIILLLSPDPQPPRVEGENVGLTGPPPRISSQSSMPPRSKA
jgi:hypothetical protein